MKLRKVISGGQTGADQGALAAAKSLGLETGGWMPRGFRTEAGPRPDFARLYGLREHRDRGYPPRTRLNVAWSDGTLIFGNPTSPGCRLTKLCCTELKRPCHVHRWPGPTDVSEFVAWLEELEVLNVAGNREERNPGIGDAIGEFLRAAARG